MFESRRPETTLAADPETSGLVLVVGNRRTSSWSLVAWLALDAAGLAPDVEEVDLFATDVRTRLAKLSPTGQVPVLLLSGAGNGAAPDALVWDSLAIMEACAEQEPALWPSDARRRALARSVTAELHAGFVNLRAQLPLDWFGRYQLKGQLAATIQVELHRLQQIWRTPVADASDGGVPAGFLFGPRPCLADFAMVPMAARLRAYDLLPKDETALAYAERLLALEPLARWLEGEPETAALPAPPRIAVAAGEASAGNGDTTAGPAARGIEGPRRLEDIVARARAREPSRAPAPPLPGGRTPPAPPAAPPPRGDQQPLAATARALAPSSATAQANNPAKIAPESPRRAPPLAPPSPRAGDATATTGLAGDGSGPDDDTPRGRGLPWLRRRAAGKASSTASRPLPGSETRRRPPQRDP